MKKSVMYQRLKRLKELSILIQDYAVNHGNVSRDKRREIERYRSVLRKMERDETLSPIATNYIRVLDEIKSMQKADNEAEKFEHFGKINEIIGETEGIAKRCLASI